MPEYRYGWEEISKAVTGNDAAVQPENVEDLPPVETPGDLLSPVDGVMTAFSVDPEAVAEASMARAMHIATCGEIDAPVILLGGFPLLAAFGAAWMDGFATALAMLQGKVDTDES